MFDGIGVEIDADETRVRQRFCHAQARRAKATADIRNHATALKFLDDALKRGKPVFDEIGLVARPEEAIRAAKYAVSAIRPRNASAMTKGVGKRGAIRVYRVERREIRLSC
jgi:hypothetical protein